MEARIARWRSVIACSHLGVRVPTTGERLAVAPAVWHGLRYGSRSALRHRKFSRSIYLPDYLLARGSDAILAFPSQSGTVVILPPRNAVGGVAFKVLKYPYVRVAPVQNNAMEGGSCHRRICACLITLMNSDNHSCHWCSLGSNEELRMCERRACF